MGPLSVNPEGQISIARIHFREVANPCKPISNRSDTFVRPLHVQACIHTHTQLSTDLKQESTGKCVLYLKEIQLLMEKED